MRATPSHRNRWLMRNHEKSLAVVRFAFLVGFCSFISRMKTPQKREHGLSNAYKAFQKNMEDIERLLELHTQEGGSEPGRRYGLEVLNKSAIVLITSFWEAFCEDLASDALDIYVKRAKTFDVLPLVLRKRIAAELKGDKHDLSPWQLAGDGWRKHLVSRLDELKRKGTGTSTLRMLARWTPSSKKLSVFQRLPLHGKRRSGSLRRRRGRHSTHSSLFVERLLTEGVD